MRSTASCNITHPSQPRIRDESLNPDSESAISGLFTVFGGYRPTRTTEFILDGEMAVGGGLSSALGIAGFTNLDVVRNPTLPTTPTWRASKSTSSSRSRTSGRSTKTPGTRSRPSPSAAPPAGDPIGKMSTADLFDINPAGSDSHMQFMNWTVDNNGA